MISIPKFGMHQPTLSTDTNNILMKSDASAFRDQSMRKISNQNSSTEALSKQKYNKINNVTNI